MAQPPKEIKLKGEALHKANDEYVKQTVFDLIQTPKEICSEIMSKFIEVVKPNLEIATFCEPCAGHGRFLQAFMSAGVKHSSNFEIQTDEAEWLQYRFGAPCAVKNNGLSYEITQTDSLKTQWTADYVITNPPFTVNRERGNKRSRRIFDKFIEKCLIDKVKAFAFVCPTSFFVSSTCAKLIAQIQFLYVRCYIGSQELFYDTDFGPVCWFIAKPRVDTTPNCQIEGCDFANYNFLCCRPKLPSLGLVLHKQYLTGKEVNAQQTPEFPNVVFQSRTLTCWTAKPVPFPDCFKLVVGGIGGNAIIIDKGQIPGPQYQFYCDANRATLEEALRRINEFKKTSSINRYLHNYIE